MEIFINAFVNDRMIYSPFNDHALKYWEMRNNQNFLFLHYEDMRRDLRTSIQEVSKFLKKSCSSEELEKLCDHLSFEKMRENKQVNKAMALEMIKNIQGREDEQWNFIRKGKVGSYNEELTFKQNELLDAYIKQIDSEKTSFRYKFE